ncbi:probable acyl-CoA dehydrogenase YngJ [Arthrobacter sp. Hiyo1]|nr:probable acyl-CoA dehydrogenase YngJ [Arthrobacter sp. Hiyo1]
MFELTEDQQAVVEMVRDFATTAIAPHAAEWDETKHFPVDVLREAGTLGMGASTSGKNSAARAFPARMRR